uniref:Gypsy retrotransposon integrase-like protein 1 n=1 Tax=Astyanax mexicanus TaxID=7994 RepID=A0A3B1JYM9_ASTMX
MTWTVLSPPPLGLSLILDCLCMNSGLSLVYGMVLSSLLCLLVITLVSVSTLNTSVYSYNKHLLFLSVSALVCYSVLTMTEYAAELNQIADTEAIRSGLANQGRLLGQHQQTLAGVTQAVSELARQQTTQQQQLAELLAHLRGVTEPSPSPLAAPSMPDANSSVPGFSVSKPELFDGDPEKCSGFLLQCSVFFSNSPPTTDEAKIGFIISRLSGKALEWATAIWEDLSGASYTDFLATFRSVFDHSRYGQSNGELLLALKQGQKPVASYALEFRTLAAGSGWNNAALINVFRCGLNPDVQRELACRDDSLTLDQLISLSIRLDQLLSRRPKTSPRTQHTPVSLPRAPTPEKAALPAPEPMDIQKTRLTPEERQRRIRLRLCLYCGEAGHFKAECGLLTRPVKAPALGQRVECSPRANVVRKHNTILRSKCFTLPVNIMLPTGMLSVPALVDSGSEGNFISQDLVKEHGVPTRELLRPLAIHAVDGKTVRSKPVTLQTLPITLQASALHFEELPLFVLPCTEHPVILGMPWLKTHDPTVSWRDGDITVWSAHCHEHCLALDSLIIQSTSVESPDVSDHIVVPAEYSDFLEVFSKDNATKLPPHRPYDCAIDLVEGATLPKTRVYPLTALTKNATKILKWSPEADQAFQKLKAAFVSAPILKHPNPDLPFVVEVDASNTGVGAVLSQRSGSPPKLHPVAFFSKKMSPAERNYGIGDRELLAVKLALEEWRHWLEGAAHPFTVLTDHKNLEYLRTAKRLNPRQARWSLFFSRFNFSISFRPGNRNTKADALSRVFSSPDDTCQASEPEHILPPTVKVAAIRWELDDLIQQSLVNTRPPEGCPPHKTYVPEQFRDQLIGWAHAALTSGHPGVTRTLQLISARYWWETMRADVQTFVVSCSVCAQCKTPKTLPAGKLCPLPVPERPWSHIAVDFVTDLPESEGYTTILTVVDRFSRGVKFIPFPALPTALQTAQAIYTHIFRHYGVPEDILSDRGPQFTSRVWKSFFEHLGVHVSLTSGFHPTSNGQCERVNQELGKFLRLYCFKHASEWSQYLIWAEIAQNSLTNSTSGLTPFQCILGYQPPLAPWTASSTEIPAVDDWMKRSEQVWEETHQQISEVLRKYKEQSDRHRGTTPQYQPGDRVWLSTRDLRFEGACRKLLPKYIGPFKVLSQVNEVTYKIELPAQYRVHNSFHVSLLKPLVPGPLAEGVPDDVPPAAVEGEDSSTYAVREVLDSRRRGGVLQYLIDWEGYGPEERCWVAAGDVLDPALLAEFHARHPSKPAPRPRGRPKRSLSSLAPVRRGSQSRNPRLPVTLVSLLLDPVGVPSAHSLLWLRCVGVPSLATPACPSPLRLRLVLPPVLPARRVDVVVVVPVPAPFRLPWGEVLSRLVLLAPLSLHTKL